MSRYEFMHLLREEEWYSIVGEEIASVRFGIYGHDGSEYIPSTQAAWEKLKNPELSNDELSYENPNEYILLKYAELVEVLNDRGLMKYGETQR